MSGNPGPGGGSPRWGPETDPARHPIAADADEYSAIQPIALPPSRSIRAHAARISAVVLRKLAVDAVAVGRSAYGNTVEQLDVERRTKLAELRRRFVEGPLLVFPDGRKAVLLTRDMMPLPGASTVVPFFHGTGEWGSLEAAPVG